MCNLRNLRNLSATLRGKKVLIEASNNVFRDSVPAERLRRLRTLHMTRAARAAPAGRLLMNNA